jgi:hypothetical protein
MWRRSCDSLFITAEVKWIRRTNMLPAWFASKHGENRIFNLTFQEERDFSASAKLRWHKAGQHFAFPFCDLHIYCLLKSSGLMAIQSLRFLAARLPITEFTWGRMKCLLLHRADLEGFNPSDVFLYARTCIAPRCSITLRHPQFLLASVYACIVQMGASGLGPLRISTWQAVAWFTVGPHFTQRYPGTRSCVQGPTVLL